MGSRSVVLLVEDSIPVREVVTRDLEEEGYKVVSAGSVQEFGRRLSKIRPDTILLDLVLPDGDGLQLLRDIRNKTDAPVIIISGRGQTADKLAGFEMGADDYIVKPLQVQEVAARVRAQVRRYRSSREGSATAGSAIKTAVKLRLDGWILDRGQLQIYNGQGISAGLTIKEFRMLETLAINPACVLSREQILDQSRADSYDISDRAVDVQIARIRKKLGDTAREPKIIRAVRGVGYALVLKAEVLS